MKMKTISKKLLWVLCFILVVVAIFAALAISSSAKPGAGSGTAQCTDSHGSISSQSDYTNSSHFGKSSYWCCSYTLAKNVTLKDLDIYADDFNLNGYTLTLSGEVNLNSINIGEGGIMPCHIYGDSTSTLIFDNWTGSEGGGLFGSRNSASAGDGYCDYTVLLLNGSKVSVFSSGTTITCNKTYHYGEQIKASDFTITTTNCRGETVTYTNFTVAPTTANTVGTQTVTLTFPGGATTTVDVTVEGPTSITATYHGYMDYFQVYRMYWSDVEMGNMDISINFDDWDVIANFSDGSIRTLSLGEFIVDFSFWFDWENWKPLIRPGINSGHIVFLADTDIYTSFDISVKSDRDPVDLSEVIGYEAYGKGWRITGLTDDMVWSYMEAEYGYASWGSFEWYTYSDYVSSFENGVRFDEDMIFFFSYGETDEYFASTDILGVLELPGIPMTSISATNSHTYAYGDTISASDFVVTATYSNGYNEIITPYMYFIDGPIHSFPGFTISSTEATTVGTQTITISYTKDGVTRTTTVDIPVTKASQSAPTGLSYAPNGTTYSLSGLTTAMEYCTDDDDWVTFTGSTVLGDGKNYYVRYAETDTQFPSPTTTVTIPAVTVSSLTVTNGKSYSYGATLPTTDFTVNVTYSNGNSAQTTKFTISPSTANTINKTTVTVSFTFRGAATTKDIDVTVTKGSQAAPTGIGKEASGSQWKITGLTTGMQYATADDYATNYWTTYTSGDILDAGVTYYVRYAANTNYFASPAVTIELPTVTLSSISATNSKTYAYGDVIMADDFTVTATYSNDSTAAVKGFTISATKAIMIGTQTITVTYGGKTTTCGITVTRGSQSAPTGLGKAVSGRLWKITGLRATMEYSTDQSSWTVYTDNTNVTGAGITYYVRFSGTAYLNASEAVAVELPAVELSEISAARKSSIKSYIIGVDEVLASDFTVTGTFSHGGKAKLDASEYEISPSGILTGATGTRDVTVTASGKTTTVKISAGTVAITGRNITINEGLEATFFFTEGIVDITTVKFMLNNGNGTELWFTGHYNKTTKGWTFDGFTPQHLASSLTVYVYVKGVTAPVTIETTMLDYLSDVVAAYPDDSELIDLIADLTIYCSTLQTYSGRGTEFDLDEALASYGFTSSEITELKSKNSAVLASYKSNAGYLYKNAAKSANKKDSSGVARTYTFNSLSTVFDTTNKVKVQFTAPAGEFYITVKVGDGDEVDYTSRVTKNGSYYVLETDGIQPTDYAETLQIRLYNENGIDEAATYRTQTLTTNFNTIMYLTYASSSSDSLNSALTATYNYGLSASAYVN